MHCYIWRLYRKCEFITNIGFHMPIAFILKSGDCPTEWYVGEFIGLIQNSFKPLGMSFGIYS